MIIGNAIILLKAHYTTGWQQSSIKIFSFPQYTSARWYSCKSSQYDFTLWGFQEMCLHDKWILGNLMCTYYHICLLKLPSGNLWESLESIAQFLSLFPLGLYSLYIWWIQIVWNQFMKATRARALGTPVYSWLSDCVK